MAEESSDFKPLPRRNRKSGSRDAKRNKRAAVGSTTPSTPRRSTRARAVVAPGDGLAPPPRTVRRRRRKAAFSFGWLKYFAFAGMVSIGMYVILTMQPAPPAPPPNSTPNPNATLVPTSKPFMPIIALPQLPTAAPTFSPTPRVPEVAIVAGHWANASSDSAPTVHDSGAVCSDGLREVDITKSVADQTLNILQGRGYHTVLLQEFDPRYEELPPFKPKVFLSIHADSCLQGGDYAFATGYKIAHAEPSDNEAEDSRLVTCLTRSYDKIAVKYDKPFNANTITRAMTEYHAFRKIDPTTPAAIIELGFLGNDRDFLVNHQAEMARGLAIGLDEFLQGLACAPAAATPEPTETVLP
jgi:N-acetylmuramoyl-L-alanine amidase